MNEITLSMKVPPNAEVSVSIKDSGCGRCFADSAPSEYVEREMTRIRRMAEENREGNMRFWSNPASIRAYEQWLEQWLEQRDNYVVK